MGANEIFDLLANGRLLRRVLENLEYPVVISTFETREIIWWNQAAETAFGQGFQSLTWAQLTTFPHELVQDLKWVEDIVSGRAPRPHYTIQKHYNRVGSHESWYARCQFHHLGKHEIRGQVCNVFLGLIREITNMNLDTAAEHTLHLIKRRIVRSKPVVASLVAAVMVALGAITEFLSEWNQLQQRANRPPTAEEIIRALQASMPHESRTNRYE